jgi:hypothetical protein
MEPMIDYEILGEVLIPLENGNFLGNKSPITYQDLNKCHYKLFRKILFQGEFIKFYITLQSNKKNIPDISSFFSKIQFNIEFESTDIGKNFNINKNELTNDAEDETDIPAYKFYCSNKNIENFDEKNNPNQSQFKEFEFIKQKEFDKDTNSQVYEIRKEIVVPEKCVNSNLLMKVNIYYENSSSFANNYKDTDIMTFYQMGIFNNLEKYKLLKTIFKEIKVINALNIINLKQLEPKIDITLLQTKINNCDNYDLIDNSLRFSKIYKNLNSGEEPKANENNKNIYIKDIRVLQDETTFDEKITDNIEFIKEKIFREKQLLSNKDFDIILFNKNKYPYNIGSGEEFNLIIKIIKNPYINESAGSSNKINNNNNNSKNKTSPLVLVTQSESKNQTEVNKIIINTLNDSALHSAMNAKSLEEIDSNQNKKRNSLALNNLNANIFSQKIQEPLLSFGNLFKKKTTFAEDTNSNEKALSNNKDNNNDTYQSNRTRGNKTTENNINNEDNNNNVDDNNNIDLDLYFDEHFKIFYITPVILDLSSNLFYENLNMCIQMKWFNEINRYLIISVAIPEHINVNQYFEASIKIKNISFNPMNLIIQIKDDENKDAPTGALTKNKNIENVPSILSQTKIEHFGLIDCGDEKIFSLKFLPLIQGYCYLPNLTLIDIYSERKFYIVHSHKIYVEGPNKLN